MKDLFAGIDKLTQEDDYEIIKAPFGFPGGKSRSVKHITPHLPYRNTYCEPFGGSAAILLARQPSQIEVYNDRYGGVTNFYRCLRNPDMFNAMIDWLELTIQSREEFLCCRDTWRNIDDPVERAVRWYYMTVYSFGALGRNFGRATKGQTTTAGMIQRKLPMFHDIHERFKNVIVENRNALNLITDFDSPDTVFYLDPPYVDAHGGTYKSEMTVEDHRELIDIVFSLDGFVAISGFPNPLYSDNPWDDIIEFEVFCSISPVGCTAKNNKINSVDKRQNQKEVLWIKY